MLNIKEDSLSNFKMTNETRLHPENTVVFLIGSLVWCSLIISFFIFGVIKYGWEVYPTTFEKTIVVMEFILYGIQLSLILLFLLPNMVYKFQRLLSITIIYIAFQCATIGFLPLVIHKVFGYPTNFISLVYIGLLI